MSMKFDHTNHKKLWTWLAENPDKDKRDWPEWGSNGGHDSQFNGCFACEYARRRIATEIASCRSIVRCPLCPLVWEANGSSEDPTLCMGVSGLFTLWRDSVGDFRRRRVLALQIANLPVKDGVETI